MKVLTLMLAALLGLACVSSAGGAEPPTAAAVDEYGPAPSDEAARAAAQEMLNRVLKDPYSAHVTWGAIVKDRFRLKYFGKKVPGYVLHATVNSKNGFGAYGGEEPYEFFFHQGKLVHLVHLDHAGSRTPIFNRQPLR